MKLSRVFPLRNPAERASLLRMASSTELLSTGEVAELLGTTVATVNRWAVTGKLPVAHKMPGRTGAYLFARSDVEAVREPMDAA